MCLLNLKMYFHDNILSNRNYIFTKYILKQNSELEKLSNIKIYIQYIALKPTYI